MGASDLINRISRFDTDVYRVLQKELRHVGQGAREHAQSLMPAGRALFGTSDGQEVSGGWGDWTAAADGRDLGFSGSESGLTSRMRVAVRKTRTAGVYGVVVKVMEPRLSPAASIFLLAGSRTPQRQPGWGGNFNAELNRRYGTTFPRGLTHAWRQAIRTAPDRIDAAIDRARQAIIG